MKLKYHQEHRHATWLELFFDLVFVAAISVLTHGLGHLHHGHLDSGALAIFPLAFVPVWWIWASHTLFANRFDTDSKGHRISTLVIMFLMAAMAASLGNDLSQNFGRLIFFYAVIRFCLASLYLNVASRLGDENAGFARAMGRIGLFGAAVAAVSLLIPGPLRIALFVAGLIIDMAAAPVLSRRERVLPVHRSHLVERVGLLSIILLGESVISLVAGLQGIEWNLHNLLATSSGFLLIGAIWWIYFDSFDVLERTKRLAHGFVLLYSNVLFCLGLAILATLIRHAILDEILMPDFRLLAISGMTLFYLGKQITYFQVLPIYRPNILINSTVCIAITVSSTFLGRPEHSLVGMTLGMFFYVYSNLRWTLTKDATPYLVAEPEA